MNEIFIILTSKTNLGTELHSRPEQEKTHVKSIAPNLTPTGTLIGKLLFPLYHPSLLVRENEYEICINNLWDICNRQTSQTHIQATTKNPTSNA